MFFFEDLGFPLEISVHYWSITMRKPPSGCGASVASAAWPFNKKRDHMGNLGMDGKIILKCSLNK
jgi:hypothetical protein